MQKLFRGIAFCCLLGISTLVNAESLWLDANIGSLHRPDDSYTHDGEEHKYNQQNYGLGATMEWNNGNENFSGSEISVGFYDNSYDKLSFYAAATMKYDFADQSKWIFAPGITVGAVTGYDDTPDEGTTFMVAPMIALGYDQVRANIRYVPSTLIGGDNNVFMFQISFKAFIGQ